MILIGLADYADFAEQMLGATQQTLLICILAVIAGATVLAEVAWFLWIHNRGKSALAERERRSLRGLHMIRRPSLAAYWTFLLAMMTPVLGMAILERIDPRSAGDALSNLVIVGPLGVGAAFLTLALVRRIMRIGRDMHEPQ